MATPIKKPTKVQTGKVVVSPELFAGKPVEEIVWTALPNGVRIDTNGGKSYLKLSVFVAPRLRVANTPLEPRLSSFPNFLDWPARIKAMEFDVQFGSKPKVRASKVGPEPDSSLWTAVFTSKTKVESFRLPDYHKRPILDYPIAHVQDYIKTKYQNIGADPRTSIELPTYAELAHDDALGRIALAPREAVVADADLSAIASVNKLHGLKTNIAASLSKTMALPHSLAAEPEMDFARLVMVHEPFVKERIQITPPELDFHSAMSSLAKYPYIMKLLGLVVDLEIEMTTDIAQSSTARVMPDWGSLNKDTASTAPKTAYVIKGNSFLPAPKPNDSDIADGMLKFSSDVFDVVTLDVDAAATSNMAVANQALTAISIPNSAKAKEASGLPALRTGGISLIRNGRAARTQKAVSAAYTLYALPNSGAEAILYADDLMRGFRVDVWDTKSGKWNSLCRRTGQYKFLNIGKEITWDDEGFVSSAVSKAPEGSGSSEQTLRMHQSMFTWNGWSLCVPRPGKTVTLEDKMGHISNDPSTAFRLKTSFTATKGSLPKLRYGNTYRLRARAVDLAGNSLDYDEPDPADFSLATKPTVYGRFEPVPSPVVVQRVDPKGGSIHAGSGTGPAKPGPNANAAVSVPVMNWGSPGESVERIVIRSFNSKAEKDGEASKQASDRHIAPPKSPQLIAEVHGMFDDPATPMKSRYSLIKAHDGWLKDVQPEEKLDLPYLPDPLTTGASMAGLPGTSGVRTVEFYPQTKWPEAKPFRLKLVEGSAAPQWDESARVLTVSLPKAEVAEFSISSNITEVNLQRAGVWHWLEQTALGGAELAPVTIPNTSDGAKPKLRVQKTNIAPSAAKAESKSATVVAPMPLVTLKNGLRRVSISKEALAQLRTSAGRGQHWMITPSRTITLVHAVQQPLALPQLQIVADRRINDTGAYLRGKIDIHPKSTSKVELLAEWDEPVDPVSENKWHTISGRAHVFEKYNEVDEPTIDYVRQRQEFHDTKYRKVRYHSTATTRFREYFAPVITNDPARISRVGPEVTVDVLGTARPAAPKLLYVVPTFGWQDPKKTGDTTTHVRTGGGLRVYLERPWFSSGEGELLGVVLTQQGAMPGDAFKPYVTMWGIDPIWDARNVPTTVPLAEQFTSAVDIGKNLSISEVPSTEGPSSPYVCVAGHKVEYDEDRQLWYCDIVINPQSAYLPFIRLALARYQPKSIANAHLSRVVLADYAQLVPDRTLVATRKASGKLSVAVKGNGVYSDSWLLSGTSEVEASLERQRSGANDELAWLPVASSAVVLKPSQSTALMTTWSGEVSLPQDSGTYRLSVKEYERYAVDKPFSDAGTEKPEGVVFSKPTPATDRRLVYADALEID